MKGGRKRGRGRRDVERLDKSNELRLIGCDVVDE